MGKFCPAANHQVTYLECMDCDEKICLNNEGTNNMSKFNTSTTNFLNFVKEAKIVGEKYQDLCERNVFNDLSMVLNSFSFVYKDIYEEIVSSDNSRKVFENIAYALLFKMSEFYNSGRYDGRNEYACFTATKLVRTYMVLENGEYNRTNDKNAWSKADSFIGDIFAFNFASEHRTLQQTFSKLVFYFLYKQWINKYGEKFVHEELEKHSISNEFYKCPLI